MESNIIVTVKDLRELNFCANGRREWFFKHGLNHGDFLKNGITEKELLAINGGKSDAMAIKAIEYVKAKNGVKK